MKPTAIEFVADLPDDQLEEGDTIIRPGGKLIAERIVLLVNNFGMLTSTINAYNEYGWEFFIRKGKEKYWILVTDMREYKIVQTRDCSPLTIRIFGRRNYYRLFLKQIYDLLYSDPNFSAVRWFYYR